MRFPHCAHTFTSNIGILQSGGATPYSARPGATTPSAWGYRKMTKAFGLINAFALLAGAVSLVLFY